MSYSSFKNLERRFKFWLAEHNVQLSDEIYEMIFCHFLNGRTIKLDFCKGKESINVLKMPPQDYSSEWVWPAT